MNAARIVVGLNVVCEVDVSPVTDVPEKSIFRTAVASLELPSRYVDPGRDPVSSAGMAAPPTIGKYAILDRGSLAVTSVSLPIQSPSGVARKPQTPQPRSRVGFHVSGRPLRGSSAARPLRRTPPGPFLSEADGLFIQRKCPPT